MELLIAALLVSVTAFVTRMLTVRRLRAEQARLERLLGEAKERSRRAGATLAAADVYPFEIPIGLKRVQSPFDGAVDALAAVDFLGDPAEFLRQVHPEDVAQIALELKTIALQDGVRNLAYRFIYRDGREHSVRVATRLVRDELGRPILISGVLSMSEPASIQRTVSPLNEHEAEYRAKDGAPAGWESFAADHTAAVVLEGELVEIDPPRLLATR